MGTTTEGTDMIKRNPDTFLPLTPLWFNILLAIAGEPRHGYAIIKEIEHRTRGGMSPATGTVYLALQRLLEDGLIAETAPADTGAKHSGRKRRIYELTSLGKRVTSLEAQRVALQLGVAFEKRLADPSVLDT